LLNFSLYKTNNIW